MSVQTLPESEVDGMTQSEDRTKDSSPKSEQDTKLEAKSSAKRKMRKKKTSSVVTMWLRRIHLYSGLFMLPWVLLYGFTALLFNHPTYMSGATTTYESLNLGEETLNSLPVASDVAAQVVAAAQAKLKGGSSTQTIELINPANASYTRQAFGSFETDEANGSVIVDLNSGNGYLRKREKAEKSEESNEKKDEKKPASLEDTLKLTLEENPTISLKDGLAKVLTDKKIETEKLTFRGIPTIEFDALVDGQRKRMRFANQGSRRGRGRSSEDEKPKSTYQGSLSIVGSNPREMNMRSYLLRLHMAHGYPVEKNSRWFWAIAVDLMFASMVFWGLSGVVMWWQIKRTRRIGFIVILLSAGAATWLAFGMHWQLLNG